MASETSEKVHHRACHLCEAICGLEITTRGDEITSIKGDKADPLSRGHICPKAVALKDIHEDPDRLRAPVKRVGEEWQEISWEEALETVASRLLESRERYGADSMAVYAGNPSVHNYGMMTHPQYALGHLRTRNRYSATSVDQLPHHLVSYWMYGHQLLIPIPDIDHSDYFLMLGANPLASNGSIMTVPDVKKRIKSLQARGGKLVVVDPRRSETAAIADQHVFIRPGTDALFLLAILHTLFSEQLADPGSARDWLSDWHRIESLADAYSPERVAETTGVRAATTRALARELAAAEAGVCYGRMGVSVQQFGTLCQWLIQLINIATGNFDKPGGSLFTRPAVDPVAGGSSRPGHFAAWHSRVRGLPEFGGELPVAALAEEMLTPGEGQIRSLVTLAGNPVLSTPNGRQLEEGLQNLDFMVSVDIYINETTRHADIILPPTSPLEHDHYDNSFHNLAVRNTARYNPALFEKPESALHDWEIFVALGEVLAARLGVDTRPAPRPDEMIDFALRSGPYGEAEPGLSMDYLKQHPSGVDLGALQPSCPQRLQTPDKRIHCAPGELLNDMSRLEAWFERAGGDGLLLIGRRHVRSNNSWLHNSYRLVKGKPRCQLLVHPEDARKLSLADGARARLSSRVGEIEVDVLTSDEMMPGTVSLPHGYGHHRNGTRQRVAAAHAGVSVNDVTDEQLLDELCGNAALNGVPVELFPAN
jgi:anaerobic selenocysteine-containing dehydrogenase